MHGAMSADKKVRDDSESFLKSIKTKPGFCNTVFQFLQSQDASMATLPAKQMVSILFKNFIKESWHDFDNANDPDHKIAESDRNGIKTHLVQLMLNSPDQVRAQLSEALGYVSKHDFPAKWQSLLPELIKYLLSGDVTLMEGVLKSLDAIFMRYRLESKSQELWKEIKYVLQCTSGPLLQVYQKCIALFSTVKDSPTVSLLLGILNHLTSIFHSLSFQDIPEEFENVLDQWISPFLGLLKIPTDLVRPSIDDSPGPIEIVQSNVCDILYLYSNKYEDAFQPFASAFIEAVWHLVNNLGPSQRFDDVIIKAIIFLTSVVSKPWNKAMFDKPELLKEMCEKVVIPNIRLRPVDLELFEFNGLDFVRRDMEGSDQFTRRRVACDFLKKLSAHFESTVTQIITSMVQFLMQEYAKNPQTNWWHKDTSMFLVLALSVRGSTVKFGATKVNSSFDIMAFFSTHVLPELQQGNIDDLPLLKADCIKFVSTFRMQLPQDAYAFLLPLLTKFLGSDHFVVHTYAAVAIEKLLSFKDAQTMQPKFSQMDLRPHLQSLLTALFGTLSHEESSQNDYIMKAILQVCVTANSDLSQYVPVILDTLTKILFKVAQNTKNPQFNHFVFETIVLSMNSSCKQNPTAVESFETMLFPPLQEMLSQPASLTEFGPYVFQVLAQMLALRSTISLPYQQLFPHLLSPVYWEQSGNIHGLVELLKVYLKVNGFGANLDLPQISNLLGVFQKLVASTVNDEVGIEFLMALMQFVDEQKISQYVPQIFTILLSRSQNSPTPKFNQAFAVFLSFLCLLKSPEFLYKSVESVQPGIFVSVFAKILLGRIGDVKTTKARKVVSACLTCLLFKTTLLHTEQLQGTVVPTLDAIVSMLERDDASVLGNQSAALAEMQVAGFTNVFSKLSHASAVDSGILPSLDPKKYFVDSLKEAQHQNAAFVNQLVKQAPNDCQQKINKLVC